jgi:tRNA A-37 threonylcarbamoyl transferase component Bud32
MRSVLFCAYQIGGTFVPSKWPLCFPHSARASVKLYDTLYEECRELYPFHEEEVFCFPDVLKVKDRGTVLVKQGSSPTRETNHADLIVKIGTDGHCREIAALQVIDGLSGFAPRIFEIEEGLTDKCRQRVIVMEHVGDRDWLSLRFDKQVRTDEKYLRFSKVLKALELLHSMGLWHHDVQESNVRIDSKNTDRVFLVDFEFTRPWYEDHEDPWDVSALSEFIDDNNFIEIVEKFSQKVIENPLDCPRLSGLMSDLLNAEVHA